MPERTGLRERKKQRTRESIAETARRLFAERGFDAVTVAEIARESEVAEKTVYNYFPTKEDLFYDRLEAFETELLTAIRERPHGETVLAAFERFMTAPRGIYARLEAGDAQAATEQLRAVTRIVTGSPALLAREQQVFARYTNSLASLLAEETNAEPGDVEPRVVASALLGVHRALIDLVRARVVAGDDDRDRLARDVRIQAEKAFIRLEHGLGEYAAARSPRGGRSA